jgi:aspartate/methionine/tyrosine aminotransferase
VSTLSTHTQSRRLESVQTPVIPVVGRWIAATPGTISLGQGIVSYGPPPEVLESVQRFGATIDDHRYGPVEGLAALVEVLEGKLARENRITVRPGSRVVVTAGGNLAFMNAVLAIADPGDELILSVPYYFNHEMAIVMAGARPVAVQTQPDLQLDLDAITRAITPRTRAVVTVSPNNPTGAVYDEASLRAVNALCRDRGLFHIHDEAYEYFTYGVPHFSPGSIAGAAGHTISLYSLSKAYGMASWRVGYMVIPEALWSAVNKVQDTLLICPPAVSQRAAAAALAVGGRWATDRLAGLNATRQRMREALSADGMPVDVTVPDGAFYFFLRVHSPMDPMVLTERLVRDHKVAVMPGSAFGAAGCAIRVSYGALDADTVAEGLSRLVTGLRTIVGPAGAGAR